MDGKANDKPADKGAGAKSEKTEKKCYWCRRRGHFLADCHFKEEYEKNNCSVSTQGHTVEPGDGQSQGAAYGGCHFGVLPNPVVINQNVRRQTGLRIASRSWQDRNASGVGADEVAC